jgi:hypothetical protein
MGGSSKVAVCGGCGEKIRFHREREIWVSDLTLGEKARIFRFQDDHDSAYLLISHCLHSLDRDPHYPCESSTVEEILSKYGRKKEN